VERARADVLSVTDHGAVRVLRIERPDAHNALNAAVLQRLDEELDRLSADRVRALVVTGVGRAFSAGADLTELSGLDADEGRALLATGQHVFRRLERLPVASIAAVNGAALGGGFELALACSFIVAGRRASFGLPETALGLMPGYGGTQRLPRAVGLQVARRIILTGERLPAGRAWEVGICAEPPLDDEALVDHAVGLAGQIARRGPQATARVLEALATGAPSDANLDHELALAAMATASREAREGVSAFLEKREPDFEGAR
jgi:enoyl-CoA hydratase